MHNNKEVEVVKFATKNSGNRKRYKQENSRCQSSRKVHCSQTTEQSKDSKWKECRIGRITASKAHDVIVKYNSDMAVRNETAAENLCAEICGYLPEVKRKSVQWGTQTEQVARNTFNKTMKKKHKNFNSTESGLVISVNYPYVAASPDGDCKCM